MDWIRAGHLYSQGRRADKEPIAIVKKDILRVLAKATGIARRYRYKFQRDRRDLGVRRENHLGDKL